MTKKLSFVLFILITLLLQISFTLEAKHLSTQDGIEFIPTASANHNVSQERNPPVSAEINGHMLTISINENVSVAQIMIMNSNGIMVEFSTLISSPNTKSIYISENGYYRVDIILNNGDQYYGNFSVQD